MSTDPDNDAQLEFIKQSLEARELILRAKEEQNNLREQQFTLLQQESDLKQRQQEMMLQQEQSRLGDLRKQMEEMMANNYFIPSPTSPHVPSDNNDPPLITIVDSQASFFGTFQQQQKQQQPTTSSSSSSSSQDFQHDRINSMLTLIEQKSTTLNLHGKKLKAATERLATVYDEFRTEKAKFEQEKAKFEQDSFHQRIEFEQIASELEERSDNLRDLEIKRIQLDSMQVGLLGEANIVDWFLENYDKRNRFEALQQFRPNLAEGLQILAMTDEKFDTALQQMYNKEIIHKHLWMDEEEEDIIIDVEFRCVNLNKQYHASLPIYVDLLHFLYTGTTSVNYTHYHPRYHDVSITVPSLFQSVWNPDYVAKLIPPFQPMPLAPSPTPNFSTSTSSSLKRSIPGFFMANPVEDFSTPAKNNKNNKMMKPSVFGGNPFATIETNPSVTTSPFTPTTASPFTSTTNNNTSININDNNNNNNNNNNNSNNFAFWGSFSPSPFSSQPSPGTMATTPTLPTASSSLPFSGFGSKIEPLKLWFSSPDILDGRWVQFHGTGATLIDMLPANTRLTIGQLCNENNFDRAFTSIHTDESSQRLGAVKKNIETHVERTSAFQISIKWE